MEELTEAPCAALPKPEYIARQANRLRQKLRPEHPRDLDFELVDECLPEGFLRADLEVDTSSLEEGVYCILIVVYTLCTFFNFDFVLL